MRFKYRPDWVPKSHFDGIWKSVVASSLMDYGWATSFVWAGYPNSGSEVSGKRHSTCG